MEAQPRIRVSVGNCPLPIAYLARGGGSGTDNGIGQQGNT